MKISACFWLRISLTSLCLIIGQPEIRSQSISPETISSIAERTMKAFQVPGMAIGIIQDKKIVHLQGYGVRSIRSGMPVNSHTLFGIASNSKAFTATALGLLVQEGKVKWDDKVIQYIPEMRMHDAKVTLELSLRDLLSHRCGLNAGAGDLMIWPDSGLFTRKDLIYNLRFLKPVSEFRSQYAYNNLMFILAGEVIERTGGLPWEGYIENYIMYPLGMKESRASFHRLPDTSNVIDAHAVWDNELISISRNYGNLVNPAGGIYSNVNDLCQWVLMYLNRGLINASQTQFIENAILEEMMSPQINAKLSNPGPYNSSYSAYGLGWRLRDAMGYRQVSHTGALAGMSSQIAMIPELGIGIIVLTNQQSSYAHHAVIQEILDIIFKIRGKNRVLENLQKQSSEIEEANKITREIWNKAEQKQEKSPVKDPQDYTGFYRDPWLGGAWVEFRNEKLMFRFEKAPRFSGELIHFSGNRFIAKWFERSLDADAFVDFIPGQDGKAELIRMNPISPLTDFSYDFEDLEFTRSEK